MRLIILGLVGLLCAPWAQASEMDGAGVQASEPENPVGYRFRPLGLDAGEKKLAQFDVLAAQAEQASAALTTLSIGTDALGNRHYLCDHESQQTGETSSQEHQP